MKRNELIFIEDFLPFLYRRQALEDFYRNHEYFSNGPSIPDIVSEISPDQWLEAAFPFARTPQGRSYWDSVSDTWKFFYSIL